MNITTNTSTVLSSNWPHSFGRFSVSGTPDGATVTLSLRRGSVDLPYGTPTTFENATGVAGFIAKPGDVISVVTAGGGASLDIDVFVEGLPNPNFT